MFQLKMRMIAPMKPADMALPLMICHWIHHFGIGTMTSMESKMKWIAALLLVILNDTCASWMMIR
jgi:hypothetical protein